MNLFCKVVGDLMGRIESTTKVRSRRSQTGFGPLAEPLETRAMLSQVALGAAIVVPHPAETGSAVVRNVPSPSFHVAYQTNPMGTPGDAGRTGLVHPGAFVTVPSPGDFADAAMVDLDDAGKVESTGQIEVQLVEVERS
jgi:hypothetical protein